MNKARLYSKANKTVSQEAIKQPSELNEDSIPCRSSI